MLKSVNFYGVAKLGQAKNMAIALSNLLKFNKYISKKPKFLAIICGTIDYIAKDDETGIYTSNYCPKTIIN